jgi:hypothetical protein
VESGWENHAVGLHAGVGEGEAAVKFLLATPLAPAAQRLCKGVFHG